MERLLASPGSWVVAVYAAASLVTFFAYGLDKRRARSGGRRIPERRLHLLALAGGFPGAYAGRRFFRHKTRKTGFSWVLHAIAALHALLWVLWACLGPR